MARIIAALTRSRVREGLARVAPAHEVDGFDVGPVDSSDVAIARNLGPVFREYCAGVGVNLALPRNAHPGALEAEIETADPSE